MSDRNRLVDYIFTFQGWYKIYLDDEKPAGQELEIRFEPHEAAMQQMIEESRRRGKELNPCIQRNTTGSDPS